MSNLSPGLGRVGDILTHTERGLARPVMVLLADAHRHADEAEAGVALVHHTAPVVVVLSVDVSVDDGLGGPTVPSLGGRWEKRKSKRCFQKMRQRWGEAGVVGKELSPKHPLLSQPPLKAAIQEGLQESKT